MALQISDCLVLPQVKQIMRKYGSDTPWCSIIVDGSHVRIGKQWMDCSLSPMEICVLVDLYYSEVSSLVAVYKWITGGDAVMGHWSKANYQSSVQSP